MVVNGPVESNINSYNNKVGLMGKKKERKVSKDIIIQKLCEAVT